MIHLDANGISDMGSGASVFVCGSVAARNVTTTRNLSVEHEQRQRGQTNSDQLTTRAVRLTTFILFVVSSAYLLQLPQVDSGRFPLSMIFTSSFSVPSYILRFCFCLVVFDNVTKTLF